MGERRFRGVVYEGIRVPAIREVECRKEETRSCRTEVGKSQWFYDPVDERMRVPSTYKIRHSGRGTRSVAYDGDITPQMKEIRRRIRWQSAVFGKSA